MIEKIGPTIHKGDSIYNTGGGGTLFFSDFSNFDAVNKIDTPIVGKPYSVDDINATETITALSSPFYEGLKNFLTVSNDLQDNTIIRVFVLNEKLNNKFSVSAIFNFYLSIDDDNGFIWFLLYKNNSISNRFIFSQGFGNGLKGNISFEVQEDINTISLFNGAVDGGLNDGYRKCNLPIDKDALHKFRLSYDNGNLYLYVEDILYVKVVTDGGYDTYRMRLDPRYKAVDYITCIKSWIDP